MGELVFRVVLDGDAVEQIAARVGRVQTADDVHQRGFAGAGGADHADEFVGVNVHGRVIERAHPLVAHGVELAEIADIDHGRAPPPMPLGGPPAGPPPG